MPTYDYECSMCAHRIEIFEKMDAATVKKCPGCGRKTFRRLPGMGAGVVFKGSGFHATDYARKTPGPAKKKTVRKEKPPSGESGEKPASDGKKEKPSSDEKKK